MHFSFMEKLGGGLLIVLWVLWGGNQLGNFLVHASPSPLTGSLAGEVEEVGAAKSNDPAKPLEMLLAEATPEGGAKVFRKCTACHTAEKGAGNKVGPNLFETIGKDIASTAGFAYSDALKGLPGEWTYETLDHFLAKPAAFAKGTKMTFAGLPSAVERAQVIRYLQQHSDAPKPLP